MTSLPYLPGLFETFTRVISPLTGDTLYFAKPCASYGYYRGTPIYGGDTAPIGISSGPIEQGAEQFISGSGPIATPGICVPPSAMLILAVIAAIVFATVLGFHSE